MQDTGHHARRAFRGALVFFIFLLELSKTGDCRPAIVKTGNPGHKSLIQNAHTSTLLWLTKQLGFAM